MKRERLRRMRVLYLNHVSQIFGAERSLLAALPHLERLGVIPSAALPGNGPLVDELRAMGILSFRLRAGRLTRRRFPFAQIPWLVEALWDAAKLAGQCKRERFSLVHANSTTASIVAGLCPSARPMLWQARDLSTLGRVAPWLSERAAGIVAVSEAVRKRLLREGVQPEKVRVIHNGIGEEWFEPRPEEGMRLRGEWGVKPGAILVGSVGQLVSWKRHEDAIDAVGILRAEGVGVEGVVVGADLFGEDAAYAERIGRKASAAPGMRWVGYRQDMPSVMAALDVLVCASREEPFGRVLIEAMASGKPVIATRGGGADEVVVEGQTGFQVDPESPGQIADALRGLLGTQDLMRTMGERGRERARSRFSASRSAESIKGLYDSLVGVGPGTD